MVRLSPCFSRDLFRLCFRRFVIVLHLLRAPRRGAFRITGRGPVGKSSSILRSAVKFTGFTSIGSRKGRRGPSRRVWLSCSRHSFGWRASSCLSSSPRITFRITSSFFTFIVTTCVPIASAILISPMTISSGLRRRSTIRCVESSTLCR